MNTGFANYAITVLLFFARCYLHLELVCQQQPPFSMSVRYGNGNFAVCGSAIVPTIAFDESHALICH